MKGLEQMLGRLADVEVALLAGAEDGAYKAAEHILGVSNEHVPHEEATLERSGRVDVDDSDLGRPSATISYNTPYAVVQHEDMTLQHDPGRNAKFLENAMNSERSTTHRVVANSIDTMLKRAARRR